MVSNTAIATFRQIIIAVFDKLASDDASNVGYDSNDICQLPSGKDAFDLFQDLCALSNEEPSTFLKIKDFPKDYGMELLEAILSQHHVLIKNHAQLFQFVQDKISTLLIKSFTEKLDYSKSVKIMRLSLAFVGHFHDKLVRFSYN
jgi:hypothetical protein